MGRKAVFCLFTLLLIALTAFLLAAAVACRYASGISPVESDFWAVAAMMLPVVLLANLGALVFWLFKRRWIVALMPVAAIVVNMGFISSMVQLPDMGKAGDEGIRVATLNVDGFNSLGNNGFTIYTIAELAREERVDVLCMQEFLPTRKLPVDSIATFFAPGMPYLVGQSGQAIASRYPIRAHGYVRFPGTHNDYLWADLDVGERCVRVFSVHMQTSGISGLQRRFRKDYNRRLPLGMMLEEVVRNGRIRAVQADEIRAVVDTTRCPVILAGDFNDTPSSYVYHRLKGDMTDGFRAVGNGYGGTFREMGGLLRIDYVLYDNSFEGVVYRTLPEMVSDHKMVVAEVRFKP